MLVIVADDVGTNMIGCYGVGARPAPTPTIDSLAAEGVMFRNAWANPVCTPTRAALMSGRFGFRTGVGNTLEAAGVGLPLQEITIPEALDLGGSGYAHAAFGKWHVQDAANGGALSPNWAGFSFYSGFLDGRFLPPHSYYHWPKTVNGQDLISNAYATTVNVNDALQWIGAQTGPWLCYLAFNAAHTPIHEPPPALHSFEQSWGAGILHNWDFFSRYQAMIEAMDSEIGRLLASMDPAVLARTNIIFLSDNGTPKQFMKPPFDSRRAKGTLYEGGVHVPFIIRGPRVAVPGGVVQAPICAVDVYSTVLEIAGLDPEAILPPDLKLDSDSLLPHLQDPELPSQRGFAYTEIFGGPELPGRTNGVAIRDGKFKLIRYDSGTEEYYNLDLDAFEADDILRHLKLNQEEEFHLLKLRLELNTLHGG